MASLVALSSATQAQTLEEKLEKKLEKPFVKNVAWVMDFSEAQKQAKAQNKLIFAYFTRSYSP